MTIKIDKNETYQKYLDDLKSSNKKIQLNAAQELYSQILNDLKNLKREEESIFIDLRVNEIKKLGNERNTTSSEKQACILYLICIINLDNINIRLNKTHQTTFLLLLRNIIQSNDKEASRMASRAMGRLAVTGVDCDIDFKNALENLRSESNRYMGIIASRELALASPSRLFLNSNAFYEDIMPAICDKDPNIRKEACELFRLSLKISISREGSMNTLNITKNNLLRRSSTQSSLTASHESTLTTNTNTTNGTIVTYNNALINDRYFAYQYKACFENSVKELEILLREISLSLGSLASSVSSSSSQQSKQVSNQNLNRDDRIHGCLLIILEILKFSNLDFEKLIEQYLDVYAYQNTKETIKNYKDLHILNVRKTLKSLAIENELDLFEFLFKSDVISTDLESKYCLSLIQEKYDAICSCLIKLYSISNRHIQQTVMFLIPRLANFDKKRFGELYLDESIKYLHLSFKKVSKYESLFCTAMLSLAIGDDFSTYTDSFIKLIQSMFTTNQITQNNSNQTNKKLFNIPGATSLGALFTTQTNTSPAPTNSSSNTTINLTQKLSNMFINDELNAILACISAFSKSLPSQLIIDSIMHLLEPLMLVSVGVTYTMRVCLNDISQSIPQLKPSIHENLLKIMSQILTGKPLCQLIQNVSINQQKFDTINSSHIDQDLLIEALQTLRSFDFNLVYVILFLRYCIDTYLQHESQTIKIESILTSTCLLNRLIEVTQKQESKSLLTIISTSLQKLLVVALTDNEPNVRYYVIHSLNQFNQSFSMFLALPDNLNNLFMCIRDEKSELRELCASLISSLSEANSAYILPFIRKILMQLLIEVDIYPDVTQKEKSVKMMGHLLSNTPRLVILYIKPLIDCLHKNMIEHRHDNRYISSLVTVIGQLASQSNAETLSHFDNVVPLLIELMQDFYYIQLRHLSLWALGQIIAHTGYVIEPYKKYPNLLLVLIDFLLKETVASVRRENIRILGLLGALDPFEYKKHLSNLTQQQTKQIQQCGTNHIKNSADEQSDETSNEILFIKMNAGITSLDDYYPALAIHLLMKIIKKSIYMGPRKDAIQALILAMRSLDVRCNNYVELVIPPFLDLIKSINENYVSDLLTQLCNLIAYIKRHVEPYIGEILRIIEYHWSTTDRQSVFIALIDLLQSLVNALNVDFKKYIPQVLPLILKQLKRELNENTSQKRFKNTQKLLFFLRSCTSCIENYINLIITQLSAYITHADTPKEIKQDILFTIYTFAKQINLSDNCALVFQSLVRVLDQYLTSTTQLIPKKIDKLDTHSDACYLTLEIIYLLARQLNSRFIAFTSMFDRIIKRQQTYYKLFETIISCCQDGNWSSVQRNAHLSDLLQIQSSHEQPQLEISPQNRTQISSPSVQANYKPTLPVNFNNLKACFERSDLITSQEGWRESFRKFSLSVIEETPISTLRVCSPIAHDPVPSELFNACFMSIWPRINEQEQHELIKYLELALRNSDVTEIIKVILNLAEFMERCDLLTSNPFDLKLLAEKAFYVRAYAKALHYVEELFNCTHQITSDILEQLIILNHELQQDEAASGVLEYATKNLKNFDMRIKVRWFEKLHKYEKALVTYDKELNQDQPASLTSISNSFQVNIDFSNLTNTRLELILGKMRCLRGKGDWHRLQIICKEMMSYLNNLAINSAQTNGQDDSSLSTDESYLRFASTPFISYLSPLSNPMPPHGNSFRAYSRRVTNASTISDALHLGSHDQLMYKIKISEMAAAASWGLSDWTSMQSFVHNIPEKSYDGALYRSIISLNQQEYGKALDFINISRDLLDTDLSSMASQSYERAYQAIINTQVLAELEEIISFKNDSSKHDFIKASWWKRLENCENSVEHWHKLLLVHSIVLPKEKDLKPWLKFASMCRKNKNFDLANQILRSILKLDEPNDQNNLSSSLNIGDYEFAKYSHLKYRWAIAKDDDAKKPIFEDLKVLTASNLRKIQEINITNVSPLSNTSRDLGEKREYLIQNLSKCYLKLGQWQYEIDKGFREDTIHSILDYYQYAKDYNVSWYKAWNAWAYANYDALQFFLNANIASQQQQFMSSRQSSRSSLHSTSPITNNNFIQPHDNLIRMSRYIKSSVQGFFTCINLTRDSSNCLQDILKLLTLWFNYGNSEDIASVIKEGIQTSPIEIWLQVIPQLIARIDKNKKYVSILIRDLLIDLGKHHPQALVYRLILASKCGDSNSYQPQQTARDIAAQEILKSLREHSNILVEQAKLVSEELIRVAILWHELWHESLEDASKYYFGENNVNGMLETLERLHKMMDRGATTTKENLFLQAYGRDLHEARECCARYMTSKNSRDIDLAWEKYYHVFKRITRQLPNMLSLELSMVSPKLMASTNLELAIPGTYEPNKPIIRIQSFNPNIQVISSKQRPRKISIYGSNGCEYVFLLKGHEDLRQDERVMQIFGLVNNLLDKNQETGRRDLAIQRYSVIPLSQNSGLLEWLLNCDTLHALIREYREKKKIALNIEHRIIQKNAPNYDLLRPIQKVEIFEHAMDNTSGDDLAKILWHKSINAEKWLERRTNYTRSLAVMSMVGYVLGLGDRHPSNLMLDRTNGKIIHVDFGDCFETAMTREKFPEKIPFRLTRMLIKAMEVTGIEGTFRLTCESVMKVLRNNRESVMAVLEAFVYDPLVYWKLVENQNQQHLQRNDYLINQSLTVDSDSITTLSSDVTFTHSILTRNIQNEIGIDEQNGEERNQKALSVLKRVRDKLTGYDFDDSQKDERKQVDLLIKQATSAENLCQCFMGWCAWW